MSKKETIFHYIQSQIGTNPIRLQNYTQDSNGNAYPKRHAFVKIKKYADDFMKGNKDTRWIIIPGFRGVGKTTLLAQTYFYLKENFKNIKPERIIYISLDEIRDLNVHFNEIVENYFELLKTKIELIDSPVILLLDEVQYDPNWATVLKTIWDKTKNVFVICSGSSAVSLQTNPDIIRRASFEKLYPVSFGEFLMIKYGIYPESDLKKDLKDAIYFCSNAEESFARLKKLEEKASLVWTKAPKFAQLEYLETGTFPFAIHAQNKERVYEIIGQLLDKIISKDIQSLGRFDSDTLGLIKRILYILSEADTISFNKLEQILPIKRVTIMNVFDVLEKAELIIKIPAYGSGIAGAKKPTKYLFMSPAIRQSLMGISGLTGTLLTREGKLIEDIAGMHLYREFITPGAGTLTYDSAQNGADFILQIKNRRQLSIEIGRGAKGARQLLNTMKKIKCDYGIAFSKSGLQLLREENIIQIPSYYLLLM